jgi:dihydroflavonol-4-reductase
VDWTNTDAISAAYIKSKTLAEKAAWDFIKAEGGTLELSVINPVGVFGPALGKDYSTSVNLIKSILDGSMTTTPPFTFGVVDVRDVADIHLLAMVHPDAKGERFLAAADGIMSLYDAAELIKKERPKLVSKISDLQPLDPALYLSMSNKKARTVLGWYPRSKEESILASADSLAD